MQTLVILLVLGIVCMMGPLGVLRFVAGVITLSIVVAGICIGLLALSNEGSRQADRSRPKNTFVAPENGGPGAQPFSNTGAAH